MTEEALYQAKCILPRDKYRSLVMFIRVELCQLWGHRIGSRLFGLAYPG